MRLIDADALIQSVGDRWTDYDRELVDSFPTIDAAPVVRCRECIHRYYYEEDGIAPVCTASMAYVNTPDDWFCKDGKRREDGDAT